MSQEVQVVKGLPDEWGACLRTVLFDSIVEVLSYQNNTIAVGTWDRDIIILNAITGSQIAVLSGHTSMVHSLAYSPDGVFLVSGSHDNTIKLWDMQTGGVVKTFYGHTGFIRSLSISAGCTSIASGSWDWTICLWNIWTGECYCVINWEYSVDHISFFPTDPQYLLFVCGGIVRQWHIDDHQVEHTYGGSYITFTSDGTQFASYHEKAVKVRNSSSGAIVTEFQIDVLNFDCCCFSPDSRLIAVAADHTIYVWDITSSTPNLIETFTGYGGSICLAFSSPSSLISGSQDKSIKLWQIGSSLKGPLKAPKSTSLTSVDIVSVTLQAKDGIIITSDSDGVVRTWDILTGLCKASFQTPANDHFYKRDAQLINGKLIFCWSADEKLNIWDAEKRELLWAIDGLYYWDNLKMSEDGSRVFCLAGEFIQAWSIQTGESVGTVKTESRGFGSLIVDNSRVWIWDQFQSDWRGWDFGPPGSSPVQLPYTPAYRLHPNGILLWDTGLHRIKDTRTGRVVFQLSRRYGRPYDVGWNGQYLVVCFYPTEVLVLDFGHVF